MKALYILLAASLLVAPSVLAGTTGKITGTVGSATATSVGTTAGAFGGPRQIQLSLRLTF